MWHQIGMGLVAGASALYLATTKGGQEQAIYAAAGAAMLGMTPFTVIFMLPTNNRLISAAKKEDAEVCLVMEPFSLPGSLLHAANWALA
jgi:hypothetical protein